MAPLSKFRKFPIFDRYYNDTSFTIETFYKRKIPWLFSWCVAKSPIQWIKVVNNDIDTL